MFVVITYPCGCNFWNIKGRGRSEHHHPRCPILKQKKEIEVMINKLIEDFNQFLKDGVNREQ